MTPALAAAPSGSSATARAPATWRATPPRPRGLPVIDIARPRHRRAAVGRWASEQARRAGPLVRRAAAATSGPRWCSCSPYVRARETARLLLEAAGWTERTVRAARRRAPAREGVRHPRPAHRARHPRSAIPSWRRSARHVGKFYFRPPGGESWCDVILRLRSVLEMVTREHARPARAGGGAPGHRQLHALPARGHGRGADPRASTAQGDVPNCGVTSYALRPARATRRCVLRPGQLRRAAARGGRAGHRASPTRRRRPSHDGARAGHDARRRPQRAARAGRCRALATTPTRRRAAACWWSPAAARCRARRCWRRRRRCAPARASCVIATARVVAAQHGAARCRRRA